MENPIGVWGVEGQVSICFAEKLACVVEGWGEGGRGEGRPLGASIGGGQDTDQRT